MVEEKREKEWASNEWLMMRKWVDNKTPLAIHLLSGKALSGILLWRDTYNVGVMLTNGKEVFVPKHSILYIEPL